MWRARLTHVYLKLTAVEARALARALARAPDPASKRVRTHVTSRLRMITPRQKPKPRLG